MKPTDNPRVWSGEAAERFTRAHNVIWGAMRRAVKEQSMSMQPRSKEEASAILEEGVTREHVTTRELPHGAARTRLLHLLMEGRVVDFYRHALSDELVIDIEGERPWHERRWSAPAWVAYVAGEHMPADDDGRECQCAECNERRQAEARDRYNQLHAALQAARAAADGGEPA
jgi:hypothetical protein